MSTFEIILTSIDCILTAGVLFFLLTRVTINIEKEEKPNDK